MAIAVSSRVHDRHGRIGEERAYGRLAWRALLFCAFAAIGAIVVLATGSSARAEDGASDPAAVNAEAAVGADDEDGPAGERPALQDARLGDRSGLAQVEHVVAPTVGTILRLADVDPGLDPGLDPATGERATVPEKSSGAVDPAALPDVNHIDEVESVVPSTTPALATELVGDVAHAPSGTAARLDDATSLIDATRLIDQSRLLPADAPVAAQAHDLAQVTHAITGLLPALDLDDVLAPVLTELNGTLAAPLNVATAPLDTLLVPLLRPSVVQAGDALNPAGTDPADGPTSPSDDVLPLPVLAPGSTLNDSGSARSLPSQGRLVKQFPALDLLQEVAQQRDESTAQASDVTAPAPGSSQPAGGGMHGGVGASGSSAADSGKAMIDASKVPSTSGQIGDRADSWRLPGSMGCEPGYSPA